MLTENKFGKYLTYAIGEIILVVIGILIALSINNWNQRKSERKLEQDYIFSLIEDAKTDLSNFKNAIALNEERVSNLDSLQYRSYNYNSEGGKDAALMIWYFASIKNPDFVTQTDRTISQLKNSGGMRLIKDKTRINAIVKYEESFERLYNQQVWYEGGLKELVGAGISIFNYKNLPKLNVKVEKEVFFKNTKLLETAKKPIIELGNRATICSALTQNYLRFLEEGQKECLKLIDVLENRN